VLLRVPFSVHHALLCVLFHHPRPNCATASPTTSCSRLRVTPSTRPDWRTSSSSCRTEDHLRSVAPSRLLPPPSTSPWMAASSDRPSSPSPPQEPHNRPATRRPHRRRRRLSYRATVAIPSPPDSQRRGETTPVSPVLSAAPKSVHHLSGALHDPLPHRILLWATGIGRRRCCPSSMAPLPPIWAASP
jgi:hypothetical protein